MIYGNHPDIMLRAERVLSTPVRLDSPHNTNLRGWPAMTAQNPTGSLSPDQEEWRSFVGLEGWYDVSSLGRVRSLRNRYGNPRVKMLKPRLARGYPSVALRSLSGDRSRPADVHRLIALAFLGPCPEDMEVNHKDFNRANSVLSNLEYVTHSENNLHAFRHGRKPVRGSKVGAARLTEDQVREARQSTESHVELARRFMVHPTTILRARTGELWGHVK